MRPRWSPSVDPEGKVKLQTGQSSHGICCASCSCIGNMLTVFGFSFPPLCFMFFFFIGALWEEEKVWCQHHYSSSSISFIVIHILYFICLFLYSISLQYISSNVILSWWMPSKLLWVCLFVCIMFLSTYWEDR